MAIRNIVKIGNPILRQMSKIIDKRDINEKLRVIADDMLETMYKNDGCGLAAPQVGLLKRIVVVDIEDGNVYKLVNPKIIASSGSCIDSEGCLSIPDKNGKVKRAETVTVTALDLEGKELRIEASALLARVLCHEIDHLNGILYVDKLVDDENE